MAMSTNIKYATDILIYAIDSRKNINTRELPKKYFSILLVKRNQELTKKTAKTTTTAKNKISATVRYGNAYFIWYSITPEEYQIKRERRM